MTSMNPNPNRLEGALKQALHREEPSPHFAASVLTRVAQGAAARDMKRESWLRIFSQPLIRWAAFAVVSVCLIAEGMHYRTQQRERAKGEAAKQQLMLALRIAGTKLHMAKQKVNEINPSRPVSQPDSRTPRSRS